MQTEFSRTVHTCAKPECHRLAFNSFRQRSSVADSDFAQLFYVIVGFNTSNRSPRRSTEQQSKSRDVPRLQNPTATMRPAGVSTKSTWPKLRGHVQCVNVELLVSVNVARRPMTFTHVHDAVGGLDYVKWQLLLSLHNFATFNQTSQCPPQILGC